VDAAQLFLSTANSQDIERLVEAREQFDWVLVEEAAKATGPELVGSLLLSGRRLLIGDHHQLAPMEAEHVSRILREPALVTAALSLAKRHVAPVFGDAPELDELIEHVAAPAALTATASRALRLLELFRSYVEEDEARGKTNPTFRPVSATLTEQRRMDPAIARVVSESFYERRLTTEAGRAARAEEPLPYDVIGSMPRSPIVVVDHPHVSSTGRSEPAESHRPRWHNRQERESVIDVLCRIRATANGPPPSLAILSPYAAQVDSLNRRIQQLSSGPLSHLAGFAGVRAVGSWAGTVDSFQGSEADLVILSLVRNNARTGLGALGFLRDRRRMNVALSRAKRQLVVVGSLSFLEVAVRGVSPRGGDPRLAFISTMLATLRALAGEQRSDGVPLATIVAPAVLRGSS
jgi:superfamily I DNA and/or RNA helicase